MADKHVPVPAEHASRALMALAELEAMLHREGWDPLMIDLALAFVIEGRRRLAEQGGD